MSKVPIFNFDVAKQSESVIIIAGGASTGQNINKVLKYAAKHPSVVFSANYDYGIPSDYTFFGDRDKYIEQIKNITGNIIISRRIHKEIIQLSSKRFFFRVKTRIAGESIYNSTRIQLPEDGKFPYYGIGTAGVACMVLSLFCNPKQMLLVGFDGPTSDAATKSKYDGTVVSYGKPHKREKEMRYWTQSLVPSLHDRGVELLTFANVVFFGIPKDTLGIKVIS